MINPNFPSTAGKLQEELTALRQENEALRHQASFSLSNPFPIFEFDFDGCEIYLNPAARQTLTELGLVDARPFFPPDFAHLKTILEKTELYRSTRRVNIEGHLFEEEIYLSKASGTIHLYVFDITKHLQNDAELNQSKLEKKHNVLHSPSSDMQGKSVDPGEVAYTISEQLSTQEALLQSEARFRMVLKNVPVTVAAQDKDLRFIWAYNQRTVDPTAVIGKTDTDLFPPEVASWTMKLKRQVLETERELHEQGWVSSGGQRLFLDLFVEPLKNKDGEVIGVGVATVDLTPIKLAEQALSESEARYRTLFDTMTEGFAIHEMIFDENGAPWDYRFLDVNPAFERQTGLSREMVVGKTYREILPAEGDKWVNIYGRVVQTGEPMIFENYSATLNKYYQVHAYQTTPGEFAVIFLDISQRKQAEEALRESENRLTIAKEASQLGVHDYDVSSGNIQWDDRVRELWGVGLQEPITFDTFMTGIHPDDRMITQAAVDQALDPRGTGLYATEYRVINKVDQSARWVYATGKVFFDKGKAVRLVGTVEDITDRKRVEEALRRATEELEQAVLKRTEELRLQTRAVEAQRKRFNDVLEILPAYLILLTPDYHVAFANRYFRERFGEDQGRRCYEYLFGRDTPCEICETYKVLNTMRELHWEWTGPDNHNYDVFDFPFTDVDGTTLILEMGIDITGRKQAEDKLRLLNAYNRRLLEANLDALVTITSDGKIGDVNTVTEAITGYPRQELIGTDFHSYFTDPIKARVGYEKVFESGQVRDYELEIQHRDGYVTPVIYNASLLRDENGMVTGVFAAARDITERKRAESELVVLKTALEAAANGVILTDKDGSILWTNSAFSRMTGYQKEEIVGKNPRFLKSGKQDDEFYRRLWDTILAGKVWRGELINRRKDGSLYDEEQTITPVFDAHGRITNFISIKQDITSHKQDEEALRRSEEQYRSLTIATTQIVWSTNAEGEVIEDQPTWEAYTGQFKVETLGKGWINALHPDDQERVAEVWKDAVRNRSLYDTEYRIRSRTGEYGDFSVRGVPIWNKDGSISGWIGTCTDITEKKNYQDQLLQAEKHAAIGRMVGSVTHEINNPLQTIKNCLYLLQQDTGPDSPNMEPLEMALSETQRLSNIVGQLRQLYRPQVAPAMRTCDVLELVEKVHSLMENRLCNTSVVWQPLPGLHSCRIDCIQDQIIEVLLNICSNAIEAMQPGGGTLSLNMVSSTDEVQVGLVISDTGPGVKEEVLPHIFEPFVTTKEYGLGLGLSICYGIIQKHNGQITVDSQPGQGTSFTIWLPLTV